MNTGNTGQRYKMAKLASIRQESNKVIKALGNTTLQAQQSEEQAK